MLLTLKRLTLKNQYTVVFEHNDTFPVVFLNGEIATSFSKIPKKIIQTIADKADLYLYGETSMYTNKHIFKVGKINNNQGGVTNLFSTESRAAFNAFVCGYPYNNKK